MLTYLLIDVLSVLIPFAYSFHPRLQFHKTWFAFWPAVVATAAPFLWWDSLFTQWGVWGFNPCYLTGLDWFHLPVEEWLFFICIPYACVFTYHCLKRLIQRDFFAASHRVITAGLAGVLVGIAIFNLDRLYTSTTFLLTALFLLLHLYVFKSEYMGRFYVAYAVLLLPFLLVNGILTGLFIEEQVVWYNNAENLGLRILTIPVEDTIYGLLLILMNVTIYEWVLAKRRLS